MKSEHHIKAAKARAASMTAERRREIARMGGLKKQANKLAKATCTVDCEVQ